MMTEEKVKDLTKDIQRRIKSTNRWLSANKSIGNPEGEAFRQIEIYELALAALTQPASAALKLPEYKSPCDYPDVFDAFTACKEWNRALNMVKELNGGADVISPDSGVHSICSRCSGLSASHTAPIEPTCATGGAEWVKVSDVEIEQELISLQSGNGQLRGESFYQEALKELLALRKAFSEPYGWITEYSSIPAGIGGMTYSFHDNRQDAQDEAEAYDGFAAAVIRKP